MSTRPLYLLTHDRGLYQHWSQALATAGQPVWLQRLAQLPASLPEQAVLWLDADLPDRPAWHEQAAWSALLQSARLVLASANPQREVAVEMLDRGCAGYCHAFADAATLAQVQAVVEGGHIWVGRELMQQMLHTVCALNRSRAAPPDWAAGLTEREQEVARQVAQGASNRDIAELCNITERTVKAHLAAAFAKLGVVDRLQLALRVHGIR